MLCCRDIDMAEFLANDDEVVAAHKHTVYDLIANICHDGQPGLFVCACPCLWFVMVCVCVFREGNIPCSCATEGEGVVALDAMVAMVVLCRGRGNGLSCKTCMCRTCFLR